MPRQRGGEHPVFSQTQPKFFTSDVTKEVLREKKLDTTCYMVAIMTVQEI